MEAIRLRFPPSRHAARINCIKSSSLGGMEKPNSKIDSAFLIANLVASHWPKAHRIDVCLGPGFH